MSNLQDVPLAEPEEMSAADSEAQISKTNSLKRFFKISKKPAVKEYASELSLDDDNKELRKTSTLSRIFSRKKLPNKDGSNKDEPEQSSSMTVPMQPDKSMISPKPIKSSMSMYWKRLFHLHKAQSQAEDSGPEQSPVNGPEEVHELKLVQNDSEAQNDLDEPDDEPKQKSQPDPPPKPESKNVSGAKNPLITENDLNNAPEPKDGESKQPTSVVDDVQ